MHQRTDAFYGLAFAQGNLGGVNECRTVQTDIDKGGLHAG